MPEGGVLGFHCRHLYEESHLASTESKIAKGGGVAAKQISLKNEDAVIAVAAASFDLPVRFLRMLSDTERYCDETFVLKALPMKRDAKKFGRSRTVDGGWRTMTATPDEVVSFCDGTLDGAGDIEYYYVFNTCLMRV